MFGIIVSGRLPVTDFITVSETQIAFQIPAKPLFNYIVVFLLPGQAFPDNSQACVFLQLCAGQPWSDLGALSAEKPSRIFRIRNVS
jgi:hypothetical protein